MTSATGPFLALLFSFLFLFSFAQEEQLITGKVTDAESGAPLAFASVSLKNHPLGTACDENGVFHFRLRETLMKDTLIISFIGYHTRETDFSKVSDTLRIRMSRNAVELGEVVVYPLSPTDYIKRALEQLHTNYPVQPFETIAYYREKLTENGNFLEEDEGMFKTYYPSYQDTIPNQYQLLLHRKTKDIRELEFMKKQRRKSYEKSLEKAEKKNDTAEVTMAGSNLKNIFSGPDMILSLSLMNGRPPFLDSNKFREFRYHFGAGTVYQGRELIVIHFKSKGKIAHARVAGKIMLDINTYAFVAVDYSGEYVIPILLRPILFVAGVSIKDPSFHIQTLYEPYEDKWYPKKLHWDLQAQFTKKYLFSKNEHSFFEVGQLYVINEVKTENVSPIPEKKRFIPSKDMEEQVHPEAGIKWTAE